MHQLAFYKQEKEEWRRNSMLTFHIGRFGNSDPKKFPSSVQSYMPELWDDEDEEKQEDALIAAARYFTKHKHLNGVA